MAGEFEVQGADRSIMSGVRRVASRSVRSRFFEGFASAGDNLCCLRPLWHGGLDRLAQPPGRPHGGFGFDATAAQGRPSGGGGHRLHPAGTQAVSGGAPPRTPPVAALMGENLASFPQLPCSRKPTGRHQLNHVKINPLLHGYGLDHAGSQRKLPPAIAAGHPTLTDLRPVVRISPSNSGHSR